jgi:hypothetical protein
VTSFEDVIAGGDVAELTDLSEVLSREGPVDMTALLTRRFVWDTTLCKLVPELLEALQMQFGSEEGMNQDHRESHYRLSTVMPLENIIQGYGHVLASVLSQSLIMSQEVEIDDEAMAGLVEQNRELIVIASRARR